MILFIDTTDLNKITLALVPETGKVIKSTIKIPYHESSTTLAHIDKFLRTNKVHSPSPSLSAKALATVDGRGQSEGTKLTTDYLPLTTIFFCSGPGSFTGIRIAASLTQALGFAWQIPIRAIPKEKVPKNLRELTKLKTSKKLTIDYGRPAI